MQLRAIEIIAPKQLLEEITHLLEDYHTYEFWEIDVGKTKKSIRFFVAAESTKELLDTFDSNFSKIAGFRIIITAVEATIPHFEEDELPDASYDALTEKANFTPSSLVRIPLQELYATVWEGSELGPNIVILFALSAVVAAIGFLETSTAIVIGSMVIAPFLGPNVGLALGATLGDKKLIKKSSRSLLVGTCLVFLISLLWGIIDNNIISLISAPGISYYLIVVAFVSGVAAILSLMRGAASALVGVMVAVALLPPLVLSGLFLGGGFWFGSLQAFLLFAANIICLNLAGVLVFWLAGIKPTKWWEAEKARLHTQRALTIWTVLFALLVVITYYLTA